MISCVLRKGTVENTGGNILTITRSNSERQERHLLSIISVTMGQICLSGTVPPTTPLSIPQDETWVGTKHQWNYTDKGKQKDWEKTCLIENGNSNTELTWAGLWANPASIMIRRWLTAWATARPSREITPDFYKAIWSRQFTTYPTHRHSFKCSVFGKSPHTNALFHQWHGALTGLTCTENKMWTLSR